MCTTKSRSNKEEHEPDLFEDTATSQSLLELTPGIEHALDGRADKCSFSEDDKLKSIRGDKCDVLAASLSVGRHCERLSCFLSLK